MARSISRIVGALGFVALGAVFLVTGAKALPQGMLEFRLRLEAQALFADALTPDADLQADFIVSTADQYPGNSRLQATAYRVAILLDALRGDDLKAEQSVALARRGEAQLLRAPANPYLWINQANVAATAFAQESQNDPALEALLKSFELGLYEFQLFQPRSVFCLTYVENDGSKYADACAQQKGLYKSLMPEAYERFKAAYGVET